MRERAVHEIAGTEGLTAAAETLASAPLTKGLPPALLERLAAAMVPVHLSGGQWLFEEGDVGDAMYLILGGRIQVVRNVGGSQRVVALLQSSDMLGELALLGDGLRSAGALAVRDCDLLMLRREDFMPLLADPRFAGVLLAQVTQMLRADPVAVDPAGRRAVVAVVGHDPRAVSDLVAALTASLTAQGVTTAVLRAEDLREPDGDMTRGTSRRLDHLEQHHEMVLLDGGSLDDPWSHVCIRQADRVAFVPDTRTPDIALHGDDIRACDLVVHSNRQIPAALLDRWDAVLQPRTHHLLRAGNMRSDVARMARRLSGRALGLVLSGGGARGMAHIGVLQALEESGTVIDRFGGTSMGALIGALAATGRTAAQVRQVAVQELLQRRPFSDYTIPRTALIRGVRAHRMLTRLFADQDVRHLARPYFAVSADLVHAQKVVHRHGLLADAVACSISLPGIAPPRLVGDRVLVDGGVLDNLPVGEMTADGEGQVIAVDLTRPREFVTADGHPRIPGIVETLSTTMALANLQQVQTNRGLARLVIDPDVAGMELLDFSTLEAAAAAGHAAATAALAAAGDLSRPATIAI